MHTSIFFDLRDIYTSEGGETLLAQLQDTILPAARGNSIFLSMLTQNAIELTPPLGFFKQLVVDSSGEHLSLIHI